METPQKVEHEDHGDLIKDILKINRRRKPKKEKRVTKAEIKREEDIKSLWEYGIISWKLDTNQMSLYRLYHKETENDRKIGLIARQNGKSYAMGVIAIEECLQNAGICIAYIAPTTKMARGIVRKNFVQILDDCPEELKPKYDKMENVYTFANGSVLKIYGTDNQAAEGIRGNTFDRVIIDEAGFIDKDEFDYIMESIVYPTTTTTANPVLFFISTPPKEADHPFNDMINEAEANGNILIRTVYDCPRLSPEKIQRIAKNMGGEDSEAFKREYLCKRVVDSTTLVLPEAADEATFNALTRPYTRPQYFTNYVAADWGVKDWNAILFAYYDFRTGCIVIEDEVILSGKTHTTKEIAEAIKSQEIKTWNLDPVFPKPPTLRVCDNNLQLITDLNRLHDLNFLSTKKDNKDAAINEVRIKIKGQKIIINPRCKVLLRQIKTATWSKSRNDFARSSDGSHYDTIDALIYLVRNVYYHQNPYPVGYDLKPGDFVSPKYKDPYAQSEVNDHFKMMFGRGKYRPDW